MAAPCIRPRNQQTLSRKPSVCISVFVIRKLTVFAKCFPPCLFFSLLRRRQYLPTKLFIRIFLSFPLTSETNLCHWGRWHSSLLADWFEFAKVGNGGRRGVSLCFERARKILKGMGSVGGGAVFVRWSSSRTSPAFNFLLVLRSRKRERSHFTNILTQQQKKCRNGGFLSCTKSGCTKHGRDTLGKQGREKTRTVVDRQGGVVLK